MCGIAGYLTFDKSPVSLETLKKMTDAIVHRGPDGEGHWISPGGQTGFGHRRLSIIDLSENGKQPMHYADGRYTVTFNGEIYNYIELKKELVKKGYHFRSDSDTEVLLALYDDKKEKCLNELDGMFSFAIWDEKEKTLFCARDRFGEKPFHYYLDRNRFVFASEIKQFGPAGIEKTIDAERLKNYANFGLIDDPADVCSTFFRNIKKLDASHYLKITGNGHTEIKRYWSVSAERNTFRGSVSEASEKFLNLFTESVKRRLRSDVPVGSSLSGGLDSSSIVMIIDKLKGNDTRQNTFSARFKGFAKDEGTFVEQVVKKCRNVEVHYTWPDTDYFGEVMPKVIHAQDEPFGSASIVAQYAVMELAKKNKVTVLLDGQGADEQLGGYIPYYHIYLDQLYFTSKKKFTSELERFRAFHGEAFPYREPVYNETLRMKLGRYRRQLLGQKMFFTDKLRNRLINDTCHNGLKELLRYADRNSMAHSREVRLPFLSHELVEFVFTLPDEYVLREGWTKYILRNAMNDILPKEIAWRVDKIGYEPPQKEWMQSEVYTKPMDKAAEALGIKRDPSQGKGIFTQDWRLYMSSYFL